eukprot:1479641-Rhodomonas_salina.3
MEIEDRTMNDPNLRALPGSLVGRYWPAERVVMGMRASSWLRQELLAYAERIIFQVTGKMPAQGDGVDRNAICNDLTRFQHPHQRVVVRVARRCEDFDGFSAAPNGALGSLLQGLSMAVPGKLSHTLTHLDLRGAKMESELAVTLAAVLSDCQALTHLDLWCNRIRNKGASWLAGVMGKGSLSVLKHLDLSGNAITEEGGRKLASVFWRCSALEELNLSGNALGDEGIADLAGVLGRCPQLTSLELSHIGMGERGARRLSEGLERCPWLTHLNLSWNTLGAQGLLGLGGGLQACSSLLRLNLRGSALDDEGACVLAHALKHCPALAHLDLGENFIGLFPPRLRCVPRVVAARCLSVVCVQRFDIAL